MFEFSKEDHWLVDDEKTRAYDGKTLEIKGKGLFLMHVREENSQGEKRPGYVQVLIEPYDLNTALSLKTP